MPAASAAAAATLAPRFTLRRKGLGLFVFISLYVVGGAGLLSLQAMHLLGSGSAKLGPLVPLVWMGLVLTLLGLAVLGTFLTLFLGQLASDLGKLQARALDVAGGLRGAPLALQRDDEVGTLAQVVDKLGADLEAREAEIAAVRMEHFYGEQMRMLAAVAASVAHEISNPVAAIGAIAAEVAAAQPRGGCAAQAAQLVELAQRVGAIVRRLQLAAGARSLEPEPIALNAVLESVSALIAYDQRFRRVELVTRLDPGLPLVHAVEDEVVQLLFHLLLNAVESFPQAHAAQPRIEVKTRAEGGSAVLQVRDNGQGMDAATLQRAFEPLFTTKPPGRGNGLGLAACRRIAERCGAQIALESVPGGGTVATCRFPPRAAFAEGWL